MLIVTGSVHFINPAAFNPIVPPFLPGEPVLWTYLSGIAELVVAAMLLAPISAKLNNLNLRLLGAWASLALFIAVYPANIYMAIDWSDRELSEQLVAYLRLPLQFGLFYWSWALIKDIRKHLASAAA
ncbi:MAG: hypothetical protein RIT32_837 [Actinomycetota bacterium]